jgi:uncharacterized protein YggT (Ycf19 family)
MNSTFVHFLINNSFLINVRQIINYLESVDKNTLTSLYILSKLAFHFFSYVYFIVKFYKLLCYSKMTIEWFPMINPYYWPFSFIRKFTMPYFRWWSRILPTIKFKKASIDVSAIIALEALNAIIYFCVRFANLFALLILSTQQNM